MARLNFEQGVHGALQLWIAIAIPARRQTMARRSLNCAGAEDRDGIGSNLAGSTDIARAHPHMPR
jgi:hypothetical protein